MYLEPSIFFFFFFLEQANSESFAQVIKKSKRKKKPLKTKEGFPAFKSLSDVLHKIDWNNVRLYQGLVIHLNPKTVVGAKLRLTRLFARTEKNS